MSKLDLDSLPLADLKQLQKDIVKAMAGFGQRKRAEAIAVLEEKAKELGYSLSELTGAASPRKIRGLAPAKYRHPERAGTTWTGRGRRPHWFQNALDSGKSPESMTI